MKTRPMGSGRVHRQPSECTCRTARRNCCLGGTATFDVELSPPHGKASLCLYQTDEKLAHLPLAFAAENRQQIETFYRAALEAGGKDIGAPGLRPNYHANYYAAFDIAPDTHNIEVVCHHPEAQPYQRAGSRGNAVSFATLHCLRSL
jgi:hypothetical protein